MVLCPYSLPNTKHSAYKRQQQEKCWNSKSYQADGQQRLLTYVQWDFTVQADKLIRHQIKYAHFPYIQAYLAPVLPPSSFLHHTHSLPQPNLHRHAVRQISMHKPQTLDESPFSVYLSTELGPHPDHPTEAVAVLDARNYTQHRVTAACQKTACFSQKYFQAPIPLTSVPTAVTQSRK